MKTQWTTARASAIGEAGQNLSAKELIQTLRQLEQQLRDNETAFNMTLEQDLLEACIYDGKALRSRYRYYMNLARARGIRAGEED